jgi:hypothetical protein
MQGRKRQTVRFVRSRQRGAAGLVILLVLAAAIGGYLWWRYFPESLPKPIKQITPPSAAASPILYKWKDAKGQWHYTDQPPADRPYEAVRIDPETNVLPAGAGPEPIPN